MVIERWWILGLWWFGVLVCVGMAEAQWKETGYLREPRESHTLTLLRSGKVLVAGGYNGNTLAGAELYDPSAGTWQRTGDLTTARSGHTATLLPSGKVLVVGGSGLSSAELYDPATGTWEGTDNVAKARTGHTATLLPSGEVLVAGGLNGGALSSAELYDPATGLWEGTDELLTPRYFHTASLLPNGKVLLAGGRNLGPLKNAELYNPLTGAWESTGDLDTERYQHTATVLPSGRVLIAAGWNPGSSPSHLLSVELYDPSAGTWESTGDLATERRIHSSTLLPSGKVLVAGGILGSIYLASAELYDPATGMWEGAGDLVTPRGRHAAILLPSGTVLLTAGATPTYLSSAELYDPSTGAWASTGDLGAERTEHTSTLLPSGKVLVTGGYDGSYLASAELYDPSTGTWESAGTTLDPKGRYQHTATLLPSGEVLVVGGYGFGYLSSAELYDSATNSWELTGELGMYRNWHTATLLSSGKVLVAGGVTGVTVASAEVYDPAMGTWSGTGNLTTPRVFHTATLLPSGEVLAAGGSSGSPVSSAELYDPITGTWASTESLATPRQGHTATLLPSGKVLVAGGFNGSALSSAEVYDPATESWECTGDLETARAWHTATLLPSGKVLAAGGDAEGPLANSELYDPSTGRWEDAGDFGAARRNHATTLLSSGRVLISGGDGTGYLASAELYSVSAPPSSRSPILQSTSQTVRFGDPFTVTGSRFHGDSETSSGNTQNSAVNYPLCHLRSLDGTAHHWLTPDPRPNSWDDPMTLTVSDLPPTLNPGPHLLTVIVAGLRSEPALVSVECSLAITRSAADQTVALGETATFTIETQGGRRFQWQRDGIDIPGATGPSYTTPPVIAGDAGSTYRVVVDSGCTSETSTAATLHIIDEVPPEAEVLTPNGGEYWLLSDPDGTSNIEFINWAMNDNIRICLVEVSLLYSNDSGVTYLEAQAGGGLPISLGPIGECPHPGELTTSVTYTIPSEVPSGTAGSLYKIRVEVTDHAGNITVAESENPFFIVQPNPDSVRTLILANLPRIQEVMETGVGELANSLHDLANSPRVLGFVVDLGGVTDLTDLYAAWDADPANPDRANQVLFGCHEPFPPSCIAERDGLHDLIRDLLRAYTGVESIVLVGDDRIIPMARLEDRTSILPEDH